jgi:hypothetical protein
MQTAGMIRVAPVLPLVRAVCDLGFDPASVLAEAGWSPVLLDDPETAVPFAALGRLVAVAVVTLPLMGVCFTLGGSSSNCVGLVSEVLTRGCSGRRGGALMAHESRRRVGTRAWG